MRFGLAGLFWLGSGLGLAGPGDLDPAGPEPLRPDPRGAFAPDRSFDLLKLGLNIELFPEEGRVKGTARYELSRLGPGPLVLDQVDLEIGAVRVGGTSRDFRVVGNSLEIDLPEVGWGLTAPVVEVDFSAKPKTGLHFRGTPGVDRFPEVFSQGEPHEHRYWFPSWDHPNDRFAYEGVVKAPAGWRAHTNSGPDLVNYLVMVAAGPYEEHKSAEDPSFRIWVPPGTHPQAVARVLDPLVAMRGWFELRTGESYPWGGYLQVYVQRFPYGGMENTGATINDSGQLVDDRLSHRTRTMRVEAHELAHQWFGDLLTCRTFRELWLNEGFATFMEGDWQRHRNGEHLWAEQVDEWGEASLDRPPVAGRFFHPSGTPHASAVYVKGAKTLQMLEVMLSPEVFWAGIQHYVKQHRHSLVETSDFQQAMEEVSGYNLGWFFQQWIELDHTPQIAVSHRYADGELVVEIVQEKKAERALYSLPVAVEVGGPEGTIVKKAWMEAERVQLRLPMSAPPRYVSFDPEGGLLARVKQTQDPAAWEAQLREARTALGQRRAATALAETQKSEALAAVLADRADVGRDPLRRKVAWALGQQRSAAVLLGHVQEPRDGVRQAVLEALGRCSGEAVGRALAAAAVGDANPDLRGTALRSLLSVDPPKAVGLARKAARTNDPMEEAWRSAAFEVLGAEGGPGDLDLLLLREGQGMARVRGLEAAARLALRMEGEKRAAMVEKVAGHAAGLLSDPDVRTQEAVLRVLARVGGPREVPALEAWWRAQTVPELRALALESLDLAAARENGPELPAAERDARIEALERRLKELEAKEAERAAGPH